MAGAALLDPAGRAELIADLVHVGVPAMRVALRCVPNLHIVTDAMEAAGCPDGDYHLGHLPVVKRGDSVRLANGGLAGSILTMDQAFRNLVHTLGLSLEEAVRRTATLAADHLGLIDRGRIEPGAVADILVLDSELRVRRVIIAGEECAHVADA